MLLVEILAQLHHFLPPPEILDFFAIKLINHMTIKFLYINNENGYSTVESLKLCYGVKTYKYMNQQNK